MQRFGVTSHRRVGIDHRDGDGSRACRRTCHRDVGVRVRCKRPPDTTDAVVLHPVVDAGGADDVDDARRVKAGIAIEVHTERELRSSVRQ